MPITPRAMPSRPAVASPVHHQMGNAYNRNTQVNTYWCACAPEQLTSKRQVLRHLTKVREQDAARSS